MDSEIALERGSEVVSAQGSDSVGDPFLVFASRCYPLILVSFLDVGQRV